MGRATALRFARPGAHVFINYHADDAAADETAAAVKSMGANPHVIKADVRTVEGVRSILRSVQTVTTRLDVVVHCAVDTSLPGPALALDPIAFADAVQANGSAVLALTQSALPLMSAGASVIFVTSRGSHAVVPGYVAVGAPKALGEILIRYLAVEPAPSGIRANCVMGSAMDTDAIRAALPPVRPRRVCSRPRR
ncbi:SDR family oxidoreductase [Aeromicrobium sp. UC242_57]|uniref:SDR family oxidoreductase n=1 Tax=Aeromicrobium sp. UC242_57 TaxID=3374624 RepID=UPI0037BD923E